MVTEPIRAKSPGDFTKRSPLEVDNRISLHVHGTHMARWNIKSNKGDITLFLGSCWEEATNHSEFPGNEDEVIIDLIGVLIFGYLMERVCIERAHERIRLKRNKCKPCAVKGLVNHMFDHIIGDWSF